MMERGREGRRGGTGGGCASTPRRARTTGLKDAAVGDDGDDTVDDVNSRLRERNKKDSLVGTSVQEVPSGSLGITYRQKRKQQGMLELQIKARGFSTVREPDQFTESSDLGASDEDDGAPPTVPRRLGKFRPHGKYVEDGLAADLPTVPRKARTAILKRPQDSFCSSIGASQQGYLPVVKSSAAKPSNSKLRTATASKALPSGAISEREAEVAEALFDLSRMCNNEPTYARQQISADVSSLPKVEKNAEPENVGTNVMVSRILPPSCLSSALSRPVTSPQISTCALTPPVNGSRHGAVTSIFDPMRGRLPFSAMTTSLLTPVTAPPAEAPKRKWPRLKTNADVVHAPGVQLLTSNSDISRSCRLPVPALRQDVEKILATTRLSPVSDCVKAHCVGRLSHSVTSALPATISPLPSGVSSTSDNRNFGSTATPFKSHALELKIVGADMRLMKTEVNLETSPSPWLCKDHESSGLSSSPAMLNCETSSRPSHQTNSLGSEDGTNNSKSDLKVAAADTGKALWVGKEEQRESARQGNNDVHREWSRDIEKEGEEEKDVEFSRETSIIEGRCHLWLPNVGAEKENVRNDMGMQQQRRGKAQMLGTASPTADKTDAVLATLPAALFLASAPVSIGADRTCDTNRPRTSSEIHPWPVGYYSSAAGAAGAVWRCAVSVDGTACINETALPDLQLQKQPYLMHACRPNARKGCAFHVYIAHFIDVQQQLNGHPFMRAAFEGSATIFGSKPYNLNGPRSSVEAVFGSCLGRPLCPLSDTARESDGGGSGNLSNLGSVPASERNRGETSSAANPQAMDRLCEELLSRKQLVQQDNPRHASIQSGIGFGFTGSQTDSLTVDGAAAVSTAVNGEFERDAGCRAGQLGLFLNPCCTTASSVIPFPGTGNVDIANNASAQAQYLHAKAVVHQGPFAVPFQTSGHFGHTLSGPAGLVGLQQDVQFFANPFYTSHLMHPSVHTQHRVQPPAETSRGLSSMHKNEQHTAQRIPEQIVRSSQPCASRSQHQQGLINPVNQLAPHAQKHFPHDLKSHHTQHGTEAQAKTFGNTSSRSESKLSTVPRAVYGKENPSVTGCSPSLPSSLSIGASIQSQRPRDSSRVDVLGVKPSKPHQQVLPSAQPSLLWHQPLEASLSYPNSTAVQMNLQSKERDSSQTFCLTSAAAMSRGSVAAPGPVGLVSVAPRLAAEGHSMLDNVINASRGNLACYQFEFEPPREQHFQSASQHQQGAATGVEDNTAFDGNSISDVSGVAAEQDCSTVTSSTSNLSTVNPADNSTIVQGPQRIFPISKVSSSGNPTLEFMTAAPAVLISCPQEHSSGKGLQQLGSPSGNSNCKQTLPHVKLLAGSNAGVLIPSVRCQLPYSDKSIEGSTQLTSVQGLPHSPSGQVFPEDSEVPIQGQASGHSQMQLSNRVANKPSRVPSGTGSLPGVTGIMAEGPDGLSQLQVPPGKRGPIPRIGCESLPSLQLSNSIQTIPGKGSFSGKISSSPPHKVLSGVTSKQSAHHNVSYVSPLFGANPVQILTSKSLPSQFHSQRPSQQTGLQTNHYHSLSLKLPQTWHPSPTQSLAFPQYEQIHSTQQYGVQGKHLLIQQQQTSSVPQNEDIHEPRLSPCPLSSPRYQKSLLLPVQQEAVLPYSQPQQQSSPRAQQELQYLQNQQSHHQHEQDSSVHGGIRTVCATATTGSAGSPTLTLGTRSIRSIPTGEQAVVHSLSTSPDLISRSDATACKISCELVTPPTSRNQDIDHALPQLQFGSSLTLCHQQSSSSRNNSKLEHIAGVNSTAGNEVAEQPPTIPGHAVSCVTSSSIES